MKNFNDIQTERLLLRKKQLSDAESIFKNYASDPQVTKYLTWLPHPNPEATVRWLQNELDNNPNEDWAIIRLSDGVLMGSIGVSEYHNGDPEIGYVIGKEFWNQGYMTEAFTAVTNELFSYGYKNIYVCAIDMNGASNRVITKCGYRYLYTQRKILSPMKPAYKRINYYQRNYENTLIFKAGVHEEEPIGKLCYEQSKNHIFWDYVHLYHEILEKRETCIYIAFHKGAPAGFIYGRQTPDHEFEILNIFVTENLRGQGIGHKLVEYCRIWAKETGLAHMKLALTPQQQSSLDFFRKIGFNEEPGTVFLGQNIQ